MADELVGDGPRTPEIMEAANALAGEIILLEAIRRERRKLLTTPPPPRDYETYLSDPFFENITFEILHDGLLDELPKAPWARWLVACIRHEDNVKSYVPSQEGAARLITRRMQEYRRLEEYERRAMSRRRKLLRVFDYLTIEALRGA